MEQKLKRIKKILGSVLLVLVFSSFLIIIIASFLESIRKTATGIIILLLVLGFIIAAILDNINKKEQVLKDEVLKNDIKEKLYKDDFTKVSFNPSSLDDGIGNFMYKILTNTDSDFTFYAKVRKDEKIEIRVIKDNTKLVVQDYMISNYKFFNTYFKIE